ncbi:hypothetical protein Caci_4103 [Catenulispora acidiphila DSM 44928]|uniref:Transmembrane protein n=1 Tax=Catenulispora acidiphila (strain DSM 44928 / JCM 14897 / NBRC 102108 / NRRL B-24433 / ID139908) TaxID=479433 RepID=C7QGC2_CATAD|nr:hypothetical protein [Catenulispora acidiphila]ACU72967.1 hypothetical protein Caci_4103 [Catenulispora acidiphila DSM 44928]
MNEPIEPIEPADAARALAEIDLRREQVIRRKVFPRWYWWAHAALITALATVFQSGHGAVVAIGVAAYLVGAFAIDRPVSRAARAATPRRGLAGPGAGRRTLIGLATFLAALIAVLITTALSLKAADVPYPITIAAALTAALFAIGGQLLVRYEAAFLVRRSGSRR